MLPDARKNDPKKGGAHNLRGRLAWSLDASDHEHAGPGTPTLHERAHEHDANTSTNTRKPTRRRTSGSSAAGRGRVRAREGIGGTAGRARRRGGPTRTRPGCPVSALMPRGLRTELVGLCHQGARSALAEHPSASKKGIDLSTRHPVFVKGEPGRSGERHPCHGRRSQSSGREASLPWETLAKQWERGIPAMGDARKAVGERHPCHGRRSRSSGREASLPWETCIPPP